MAPCSAGARPAKASRPSSTSPRRPGPGRHDAGDGPGHAQCLGAVLDTDRPKLRRHYPGYLSQADAVVLIDRCLRAPFSLRYELFDANLGNRWRWRDTSHAKQLFGCHPTGRSEAFTLD